MEEALLQRRHTDGPQMHGQRLPFAIRETHYSYRNGHDVRQVARLKRHEVEKTEPSYAPAGMGNGAVALENFDSSSKCYTGSLCGPAMPPLGIQPGVHMGTCMQMLRGPVRSHQRGNSPSVHWQTSGWTPGGPLSMVLLCTEDGH